MQQRRKELLIAFEDDGLSKPKDAHLSNIMLALEYTKAQYQIDKVRATYYFPIGWKREQVERQVQGECNANAIRVQGQERLNLPF